jgi:hypothetical protein
VSSCDDFPSLPFIDARGKSKKEIKVKVRPLGCPLVRRCLSGRIEEESSRVVFEAAAWPGTAAYFGHLALSPSTLVLTQPA